MESIPTVHMWHDYVCPFCNVEATRILRIKVAEDLNFNVRFHPWPLESANGAQPRPEEEDQWAQLLRAIEPQAFARWSPSSPFWPASSALLFAAYEAALVQDIAAAQKLDLLIRQAIFQHPRPVDSIEALTALAGEAGLDTPSFEAALEDGAAERHARESGAGAPTLGIRGIPTLVLPDGRQVINPGLTIQRTGQGRMIRDDLDTLRALLRQAAGAVPTGSQSGM